jgi:hypothetical protein
MEPFHSTVTEPFHPCVRFGQKNCHGTVPSLCSVLEWDENGMEWVRLVTRLIILNSINYLLNLISTAKLD